MENHAHYTLLQTALAGVVAASAEIIKIYNTPFSSEKKADGSPVTQADMGSNDILEAFLGQTNIPIVSEETAQETFEIREKWPQLWCVDPLDGTKEFIKHNDEFAICVALIENGIPTLGIVASPVERIALVGGKHIPPAILAYDTIHELDSWQFLKPKATINSPVVIATSRSHYAGDLLAFVNGVKADFGDCAFIQKGSALKFFDLALGKADIYPRFWPTMEWDIAAGQAIIEAMGGSVINPETGKPLHYNKADLFNPHFVIRSQAVLQHQLLHG